MMHHRSPRDDRKHGHSKKAEVAFWNPARMWQRKCIVAHPGLDHARHRLVGDWDAACGP